jgi:Tfp pilus assembly PilM family ATPase
MSQTFSTAISVVGIDIGKNSFHVVGLNEAASALPSGGREAWA